MVNQYPIEIRRQARRLWFTGRFTDEEIASALGLPRPDTIRDWRREEGWEEFASAIRETLEDEVKSRIKAELGEFRRKYDQLGQVIEGRAVKALGNPNVSTRDLKAIAGTLAQTQKIRNTALVGQGGFREKLDKLDGTVAGYFRDLEEESDRKLKTATLGRCVGKTPEEPTASEDPVEPTDAT